MKFIIKIAGIAIWLLIGIAVCAQQEAFTIAGGGGAKNGSTYSAMLGDLAKYCSTDELPIQEVNTSGGIQNLDMLMSNKVKAALIPTDVMMAAKLENPTKVARIRTLFTMHPEELHLIVRGTIPPQGGWNLPMIGNVGGKDVVFNNPEDLRGRQVGAVGGSLKTAAIVNDFLKLNWAVLPFDSTKDMLSALLQGKIDAVLIVAGAPSDAVKSLGPQFKLIPIRSNADLAAVYMPTKISYEKLNGGKAVDTIATQALLVTRTFNSPEMLQSLSKLRTCFKESLPKIQDADGSHPKWQDVNVADQGKWVWYDLPVATPVPATAAFVKKDIKKK